MPPAIHVTHAAPAIHVTRRDMRDATDRETEAARVLYRRLCEAEEAGLSLVAATEFAKSSIDIEELRKLVRAGCKPELIGRILL